MVLGMSRRPWDALLHTGGWEVGLQPPAALGVEVVGRVAALGPGVTGFDAGDLVLVHDGPFPEEAAPGPKRCSSAPPTPRPRRD
jgi:NADPH:quinone reductase-like Zn-dependent oxidoreductase